MSELLADLASRHPSVGAVRSIGLFGIVELIRNRTTRAPMAPFNGTSPEMQKLGAFLREQGMYAFINWNNLFTNPPPTSAQIAAFYNSPAKLAENEVFEASRSARLEIFRQLARRNEHSRPAILRRLDIDEAA